jgi:hypothetical protein
MMILFKIFAILFLAAIFFIFRKWLLKHYYFLLGFIPIIVLILYAEFIIHFPDDKKQNEASELNKWKEEHKDNFNTTDKIQSKDSATNKYKVGDLLYDTTFSVNGLKLHYKEYLVALPENEYSYDSTRVVLEVIDKNNQVVQTIKEDIYAICSPLITHDGYSVLGKDGMFLDYNFDLYDDIAIRFLNEQNNKAVNGYYNIFLFNPSTKIFEKYYQALENPYPVKEFKIVRCGYSYSAFNQNLMEEYYEWVKGKLVLIKTVQSIFLEDESDENMARFNVTTTYYKNGKVEMKSQRIDEINYDNF